MDDDDPPGIHLASKTQERIHDGFCVNIFTLLKPDEDKNQMGGAMKRDQRGSKKEEASEGPHPQPLDTPRAQDSPGLSDQGQTGWHAQGEGNARGEKTAPHHHLPPPQQQRARDEPGNVAGCPGESPMMKATLELTSRG
ncbi:UNVERIFIED_CONTAM: hypothetical protein K2H54_030343 [Gekko kuhli]